MKRLAAVLVVLCLSAAVFYPSASSAQSSLPTDESENTYAQVSSSSRESGAHGSFVFCMEDYGVRNESGSKVEFENPLGEIVPPVEFPILAGDTIATATLRALDELGISYDIGANVTSSSFYLKHIYNFPYGGGVETRKLGEFRAGAESGWMATLNGWFINASSSAFPVEDGDVICWKYTCQFGADIGCDWEGVPSAKITGLWIDEKFGALTPAFDSSVKSYTLTVPDGIDYIQIGGVELENYWTSVTYRVGNVYYKAGRDIPVANGTNIVIETLFEYTDGPGGALTDADSITVTVSKDTAHFGLLGDANGDGKVNSTDSTLVRRYAAKAISLSGEALLWLDVSGDGKVNSTDSTLIRRYAAKAISVFPVQQ